MKLAVTTLSALISLHCSGIRGSEVIKNHRLLEQAVWT